MCIRDSQASTYLKYVPEYYTGGMNMGRKDSEGNLVEQIDKEKGFDDIGSSFYHGCKGHWLLHDIKKNGLNQPIQGVISKVEHDDYYALHIHPGSVRQGVFGALDFGICYCEVVNVFASHTLVQKNVLI